MPPPEADVSVVIPCYNRAVPVAAAIRSALGQEPRPLEVIVVDDGSTDGSAAAAADFGPPVRVLRTPNRGAAAARNTGIASCRGAWVAFLDSDDVWLPGKLARQDEARRRFPGAALVFCDTAVFRGPDPVLPSRFALGGLRGAEAERSGPFLRFDRGLFRNMLRQSRIITSAVAVRRDLPGLAFPPRRTAEDWALWLEVVRRHPVAAVDEVLVHMFQGGDNLSDDAPGLVRDATAVLEGLLAAPDLTAEERAEVGRTLVTARAAGLYAALTAGDVPAARRLLRAVPPRALGAGRWLRYWVACRTPGALARRLVRPTGAAP